MITQALAKQEADDGPSHLPLPMCHASYRLSPEVRRITYDYVAAAGGGGRTGGGGAEDPDLYRDDERMLKGEYMNMKPISQTLVPGIRNGNE